MIQKTDSLQQVISRVDTVFINRLDPAITDQYLNILSDTNSQMNSWVSYLGIIISCLGVFFTVGAIFVAYHILSMSSDFKNQKDLLLNELVLLKEKYSSDLENLVLSMTEQLNTIKESFEALKKSGKITSEDFQKMEKSINRSISKVQRINRDTPITKFEYLQKGTVTCKNCEHQYPFEYRHSGITLKGSFINVDSRCPKCGIDNKVKIKF